MSAPPAGAFSAGPSGPVDVRLEFERVFRGRQAVVEAAVFRLMGREPLQHGKRLLKELLRLQTLGQSITERHLGREPVHRAPPDSQCAGRIAQLLKGGTPREIARD